MQGLERAKRRRAEAVSLRRGPGRLAQGLLLLTALLLVGCGLEKKSGSTGPVTDETPPGRVSDLTFSLVGPNSLTLSWTSTGDDGSLGTADSTEVRMADAEITPENWSAATPLTGVPAPLVAGTGQTFAVTGLSSEAHYYFALRVWDEVGHGGEISNCADAVPSSSPSPRFIGEIGLSAARISRGAALVITCAVRNSGTAAPGGLISLSFPGLDAAGDSARIWATGASDTPGLVLYLPGDTIPDATCQPMTTRHVLLQSEDGDWDTGELNTVEATVVPRTAGDFVIEVRAALKVTAPDSVCDWVGSVPIDGEEGFTDQQGWPVRRFVVSVDDEEISVSPGSFTMGSPSDEPGHRTNEQAHEVTLTRGYRLADHEVTQAEWRAIMGWSDAAFPGVNLPVERITWFDCLRFCNLKSAEAGLDPAYLLADEVTSGLHLTSATVTWLPEANGYRLPTEAEWEYACRAGSASAFCNGAIEDLYCGPNAALSQVGWYCGNSGDATHEIRGLAANDWGFCDMHGNVWEWCWDRAADFTEGPAIDPAGPETGTERSFRNGGWFNDARLCRSASRDRARPGDGNPSLGFRVARNL